MTLEAKNLDGPEDTRPFDNGEIRLGTIAGTESCQAPPAADDARHGN